jgi:hypothetical protein
MKQEMFYQVQFWGCCLVHDERWLKSLAVISLLKRHWIILSTFLSMTQLLLSTKLPGWLGVNELQNLLFPLTYVTTKYHFL